VGISVSKRGRTIKETIGIVVGEVKLDVATIHCDGECAPILFLHGFGSTKEDYADVVLHPMLANRKVIAYDAPGCGETVCEDLRKISIPFLVETAKAILDRFGIDRFHLVGHSMGGLTALMLAHDDPERVLSFIDIEGNVAPEDCFISRQIFDFPAIDEATFLDELIERTWSSASYSCALYAASLRNKVRAHAVRGILTSMVELSDHGNLIAKLLSLPCPRMFMYGEQNASLSYLSHLKAGGVSVARISCSGHFPMYSNPVEMWATIAAFLADIEAL
jgi:pimeloyl-ACP methyl ester carboxylesterase